MSLYHDARERWGKRCPCCGNPMRRVKLRRGQSNPSDMETQGHDAPVAMGGDPNIWIVICRGCNNDQGSLPFHIWARKLKLSGDPRELRVLEVAIFVAEWRQRSSPGLPALPAWRGLEEA